MEVVAYRVIRKAIGCIPENIYPYPVFFSPGFQVLFVCIFAICLVAGGRKAYRKNTVVLENEIGAEEVGAVFIHNIFQQFFIGVVHLCSYQ